MGNFGKFSELTFANGGSPAINDTNLNEVERVVALADYELSRSQSIDFSEWKQYYFDNNTNDMYEFDDDDEAGNWSEVYPSNCTLSDETTNNKIFNKCLKILIDTASASWEAFYQTLSSTLDLSVFRNGRSSTTSDILIFVFYVSDAAKITTFYLRFGDDYSNSYYKQFSGYSTGWNVVYPQKSDFSTAGAPTGWNSIDYVRIQPYHTANSDGEYMYCQHLYMIRQCNIWSGYPQCFQKYMGSVTGWENDTYIYDDVTYLFFESSDCIKQIGLMKFPPVDTPRSIYLTDRGSLDVTDEAKFIEFISKFEIYTLQASVLSAISWYVDSNNYCEVYISSGEFRMNTVEGGAGTEIVTALDNTLQRNERIYIYFEKQNDTMRAILHKKGEYNKVLERETSISSSSAGHICYGATGTAGWGLLTDYRISNRTVGRLQNEMLPWLIRVNEAQTIVNNNYVDINNLIAYIPPNLTVKVELKLIVSCTSNTPDFKTYWVTSGLYSCSERLLLGPARGATDARDTNVNLTELTSGDAEYGIGSTGAQESIIREEKTYYSSASGGYVKVRGGQIVTDGSNPILIRNRSFIIVTPIVLHK